MFNKIQLTVFTLLVFVCCVVIFPIHCDLSDFLLTPSFHCSLFPPYVTKNFLMRRFMEKVNKRRAFCISGPELRPQCVRIQLQEISPNLILSRFKVCKHTNSLKVKF